MNASHINKRKRRSLRGLLGGVIVMILCVLLQQNSAQAATLPLLIPAGENATATSGAAFNVTVPEGPIDVGNGSTVDFVPTVPNPLDMNTGIDAQVQELNQQVQPGSDGVRRVTGFSAGALGGCEWAMQSNAADGPVELLLSGSPVWDGSLKDILPDSPIVNFCDADKLPEHVTVKANVLTNDGYASCLNQLSSVISCPLGIMIGHYCAVDNIVPGQCYASFNGPIETFEVGNTEYSVGHTRNPVAVTGEAIGKQFDPNFTMPVEIENVLEGIFPQGQPGVPAQGVTPRDILQPEGNPLPQAEIIPAVGTVGDITEPLAPVIDSLPVELQAPVQQFVENVIPDTVPQAWTDEVLPQAPNTVPTFDASAPAPADIVDTVADAAVNAGVPTDLVNQGAALFNGLLGAH